MEKRTITTPAGQNPPRNPPGKAPKTPGKTCPTCGHVSRPTRAEKLPSGDLGAFVQAWRDQFGFSAREDGRDALKVGAGLVLRSPKVSAALDPYLADFQTDRAEEIDLGRLLVSISGLVSLPGRYQLRREYHRAGYRYWLFQQSEPAAEPAPTPREADPGAERPSGAIPSFTSNKNQGAPEAAK